MRPPLFIVAVVFVVLAFEELAASEDAVRLVESKADITLVFGFDHATGVYTISLRNDGINNEVFADRFSDPSEYELVPGAVTFWVKINGELILSPVRYIGMPGAVTFNVDYLPSQSDGFWPSTEKEVCSSCVVERSFNLGDFVIPFLTRMSSWFDFFREPEGQFRGKTRYRDSQLLAEKLNYLSDIRKIELKMSCATTILSREGLRLHVETDWILLSPETYASWNAP